MKFEQNINRTPKKEIALTEAKMESELEDLAIDEVTNGDRQEGLGTLQKEDQKRSEEKTSEVMERINMLESSQKENDEGEHSKEDSPEMKPKKIEGKKGINRRSFLKIMAAAGAAVASGNLGKVAEVFANESVESVEDDWGEVKKDWEKYKEVVESSKVKENIAFLEEEYGSNALGMTYLAKYHLSLFDQLKQEEEEGTSSGALNAGNLLTSAVGDFRMFWDEDFLDKRLQKEEQENGLNAEIKGFDKMPGWTNERIKQEIESKLGKRWSYQNVSSFEYIDKEEKGRVLDIAGQAYTDNLSGIFYKSGAESIKFYRMDHAPEAQELDEIMGHEIAHHNDWESNNRMPLQERLQFMKEVLEHFKSPKRFHSVYVEFDTPDEFEGRFPEEWIKHRQLREYWAVLNERYDVHGEALKENQPQDYELVERWRARMCEEP